MTTALQEVMEKLESMGSEQTERTFRNHGAQGSVFGVKVGDLKKLVKDVKKDQQLARDLYASGNSDAMYLAGLTVNPKTATKEMLREWARSAGWYMIAEYTVAWIAAERIGKVVVNVGQTTCKVPLAADYIRKVEEMGRTGQKKKTCIC